MTSSVITSLYSLRLDSQKLPFFAASFTALECEAVVAVAERALCLMLQNYFQIVSLFQQKWPLGARVS
jgi:hypothetical protein